MRNKVGLFLMSRKGFLVLKYLVNNNHGVISFVESRQDKNVEKDYFEKVKNLCLSNNIPFFINRTENNFIEKNQWYIAIGWRWIIRDVKNLIIIHDSLLPKYRGFAPIVNALINGEKTIGVTALIASSEYDKGDIITQRKLKLTYPVKVNDVIEDISQLYVYCVSELLEKIINNLPFNTYKQNETEASYSIWRNSDDYFIDWNWPANKIERFVNAVGYPYKGAKTTIDDRIITITDCEQLPSINIELVHPGKIIFIDNNCPVVICGQGVIKINEMLINNQQFQIKKLKSRFQ